MYLLPLLPVFQLPYIFTGLLIIERAAYLPSAAFCWLLAAGLVKLAERRGCTHGHTAGRACAGRLHRPQRGPYGRLA